MKRVEMARIEWYFARSDLAEQYLQALQTGLITSLCCFAPRRKGKTEWLKNDVIPLAEKRAMRAVYCSMWANRQNPVLALIHALEDGAHPRSLAERVRRTFTKDIRKAGIELDVKGKLKVDAEFREPPAFDPDLLAELPIAFDRLLQAAGHRDVLLVVDEIQHLAKPEFHNFVAALRTALDTRKQRVKAIFTGSSRIRLQAMFEQQKAPLFQFSQRQDLPDLDDRFVDFMIERFVLVTQRTLDRDEAVAAFEATDRTPGLFRDALQRLILEGGTALLEKTNELVTLAQGGAAYAATLLALPALDRAVLRLAVEKGGSLYATSSRQALAASVGVANVTNNDVQGALARLTRDQVLYSPERGVYQIEDPQMASWYRSVGAGYSVVDDDGTAPPV